MTTTKTRGLWMSGAAMLALSISAAPAARAQQAAATGTQGVEDPATSIEDVVVTANKRAETVSTTPLAITALSQEQLRDAGVQGLRDLATAVPNVAIKTVAFASSVQVTIRGITNTNFNSGGSPAVATYVDGVYVPRTQGLNGDLYDVERLEILRGPQGTLYGRNATGGSFNVVTNSPESVFAASADAAYGSYNDVTAHGMVNLPLGDTLAVRAAVALHRNDGAFDTRGRTVENGGKADDYSGRLTALWTPTETFSWRLSAQNDRVGGTPALFIATAPDGTVLDGRDDVYEDSYFTGAVEPYKSIRNFTLRSRMEYDFTDTLSVSYVAGYENLRHVTQFGVGGSPVLLSDGRRSGASRSQWHELNLSFEGDRLSNVLGANYSDEEEDDVTVAHFYDVGLGYGGGNPTGPSSKNRSWGIFDQATFSVTETLRLIGGLRYSEDRLTQGPPGTRTLFCGIGLTFEELSTPTPAGCAVAPSPVGSGKWSSTTWRAGLQYDLAPGSMAYATATSGFKAGGLNVGAPAGIPPTFAPEEVLNYELGLKTRLLESRLSLNLAAFYSDYTNLQVVQILGVQQATVNAAAASIYGLEAEAQWQVSDAGRFDGFFNYLHATYDEYRNAVDQQNGQVFPSLDGNSLINSPRVSARIKYTHTIDLPNGGTLAPSLSVYYQSKSYLREFALPIDTVGSYTKTDFVVTYEDPTGQWNVQAYVYNLEDDIVRNGGLTVLSTYVSDYSSPRLYGVRVGFTY